MNNISADDIQGSNVLEVLSKISNDLSYEKICELTAEQKEKYDSLLKNFEEVNLIKPSDHNCPKNIDALKGKALEEIAAYLLSISGGIFEIIQNLRTSTNELDQFAVLNTKGQILTNIGIIDNRLKNIIGECKNYNKRVSVTYVGKFCSLLLTTRTKLGILFSYHGVTGRNWTDASGLIKKFYLHKENEDQRYCIIDFNINDFKSISTGKNMLQIIKERIISLKYDTDFNGFLSKHESEDKI